VLYLPWPEEVLSFSSQGYRFAKAYASIEEQEEQERKFQQQTDH
jgi:hypothetical protein